MKLTNQNNSLAEAIRQIVANPAPPMTLMPKGDRSVFWHITLEISHDELAKLFPVPLDDVNAHLEVGAHPLGEVGVQGIEDGLGEGVFIGGVVDGLCDAAVEGESLGGLGDGELDLDHGPPSETQPGPGVN